jgi:2'-hydroxyisoflavone reductase
MRLLVLGGTMFLGRHIVEQALGRGHDVTLFHRGKTHPELFPEAARAFGDRRESLEPLAGRRFDAVLDTSGYVPRVVQLSAAALSGAAAHYTFISTISVYADEKTRDQDEGGPLAALADPTREDVNGETYGGLKVLCEQAVAETFIGRVLVIRPGLIVGPHDPTDRFTYWPARMARGGDVLAPGPEAAPVQYIDVRDLAAWTLDMIEGQRTGVLNATGPAVPLTIGEFLTGCRDAARPSNGGADGVRFHWVDPEFLTAQNVAPFSDLPLWLPESAWGMSTVKVARAVAAGLSMRSLADTVRDTLAWHEARKDGAVALKSGLSPEREAELLRAWADSLLRSGHDGSV